MNEWGITARREIITNTTTKTSVSKSTIVIQKDNDLDGIIDEDVTFESINTFATSITYTTEITYINNAPWDSGTLTEYRNSTFAVSDSSYSFTFSDYEDGEVASTRIYDDVFPNELSERYNLDNYLHTVTNDNGDEDPSNDIVVQAPELEQLLDFAHPDDNVPAIFDRRITINSPAVIDNILAVNKTVTISGKNAGEERSSALLEVIEVVPKHGVLYDSNPRNRIDFIEGSYWYYDSGSGVFDTIFVVDSNNNVLSVGFDYDYNQYLEPNKKILVEKHILLEEIKGLDSATFDQIKSESNINFRDYKSYDGMSLDSTFCDSLFDIWKMTTSQLINEVKSITSHQFIEAVGSQIVDDILFQVVAQLASFAVAAACREAFFVGYLLTYGLISAIKAYYDEWEMEQAIIAQTIHNENYDEDITLSSKNAYDELWGGTMPDVTGWSTSGTYVPIHLETDKHLYKGQIILAPKGVKKTKNLGLTDIPISLDYAFQTRNYLNYSDFDDPRVQNFYFTIEIDKSGGFDPDGEEVIVPRDDQINYMQNTIMYLEDSISHETDGQYNTIFPYIIYGSGAFEPTFQFAGVETRHPVPEFYRDYPIYVDSEFYSELEDECYIIYKVFDLESSQDIELIPSHSTHSSYGDVTQIVVHRFDSTGIEVEVSSYFPGEASYSYNADTGILSISGNMYWELMVPISGYYGGYYIFEVKIEKYRELDPTDAKANHIATMQAVEQSIFQYMYQFKHAQKTQQGLSEMFYTFFVTSISTVIVTAVTLGVGSLVSHFSASAGTTGTVAQAVVANSVGKGIGSSILRLVLSPFVESFQEIFVDPYLEIIVSEIVSKAGGNAFWQVLFSSLVEGGREAATGPLSSLFTGKSQGDTQSFVQHQHVINEIQASQQGAVQNAIDSKDTHTSAKFEWSSIIKTGASLLLGTALVGFGGPMFFGASLYCGFNAIQSFSKGFSILKTHLHNIILDEPVIELGEFFETATQVSSISDEQTQYYRDKALAENEHRKMLLDGGYHVRGAPIAGFLPPGDPSHSRDDSKVTEAQDRNELIEGQTDEVDVVNVWVNLAQELKSLLFKKGLISKNTLRAAQTEFFGKSTAYFTAIKRTLTSKSGKITPVVFAEMYYKIIDSVDCVSVLNSPEFIALKEKFRTLCLLTQENIPPPFSGHKKVDERTELWSDIISIFEEELGTRVPVVVLSQILYGKKGHISRQAFKIDLKFLLPTIYNLYAKIKELKPTDLYKFQHPKMLSTVALLDIPSVETMDQILERVSDRLFQFVVETHYEGLGTISSGFNPSDFKIEFELFCRLYHIAYHLEGGDTYITNKIFEKYWGTRCRIRTSGVLGIDSTYDDRQSYNYLLEMVKNFESSLDPELYSEIHTFVKYTYSSIRPIRERKLPDIAAPFTLNNRHIKENFIQIKNKMPKLITHFKLISDYGGKLPTTVKQSGITKISSFNNQLRGFILKSERKIKASTIKDFVNNIADVSLIGEKGMDPMISSLLSLAQTSRHKDILVHGGASHKDVQILSLRANPYALAVELPIYFEYKGKVVAGHIDLLLIKDGVLYVADYKPDQSPEVDSANYLSFLNSVPQLAAYAIVLRDLLGIDQVKCITFNKDGAWEFDPDDSLAFINKFLEDHSKSEIAIWSNYLAV